MAFECTVGVVGLFQNFRITDVTLDGDLISNGGSYTVSSGVDHTLDINYSGIVTCNTETYPGFCQACIYLGYGIVADDDDIPYTSRYFFSKSIAPECGAYETISGNISKIINSGNYSSGTFVSSGLFEFGAYITDGGSDSGCLKNGPQIEWTPDYDVHLTFN